MDAEQIDNWGSEAWRQPEPLPTDVVLYSECGRSLNNIDFRSHSFKLVKAQFGGYFALVRHGGGDERLSLGYSHMGIERMFSQLDSDSRYLLLHQFFDIAHNANRAATDNTAGEYRKAFVDGRLKKRKLPAQGIWKIWIEPKTEGRA
jgi:hypothetical protein